MNKEIENRIRTSKRIYFIILSVFIIAILYSSFTNAYVPHKQNSNLSFSITSNNADTCNLTIINSPNNIITINQEGTKTSQTFSFEILGGNFTSLGIYEMNTKPYNGEEVISGKVERDVTGSGSIQSTAQAGLSLGILFSVVLLSFFFGLISWKFLDKEKTFPFGLFFLLIAFVLVSYSLYLGVLYSQDFLLESALGVQSKVFLGIMWGLVGMTFLGLTFLIVKVLKELKERKSLIKYGEGFNQKTNSYE
jgi:hypothetical protein